MKPVVSIIMPCYNAEMHLPESLGSVVNQTFSDLELIAIDDGSSDGTLARLQAETDPRIRVLTQTNQGVSAARNAGLTHARGDYIAFLDADDTWARDFLEKMLAGLQARPDSVLAYCGWQNIGLPGDRSLPFVPPDYENASKAATLFSGCRWPIHAALVRREAALAAGHFDPTLKNAEDYAFWLRVAATAPIVRVPEVLAYYHYHDGVQASSNKGRAAIHHLLAQQRYLAEHPDFEVAIGKRIARELMLGELLERGYVCYWKRDLSAARNIFRTVMKQGYGTLKDWKYMLPAWLPEAWYRWLIEHVERTNPKPKKQFPNGQ